MGLWPEHVVPRIAEASCNTKEIRPYRGRHCAGLSGEVREIGFGSDHNLGFLPPAVRQLAAVEPSLRARQLAADRVASSLVPVEWTGLDGQALELADDRFDHAVSAFTLCTIPDPVAA